MSDSSIANLTNSLTGANAATGDLFVVVDVDDTSMAATGTDKKITLDELATAVALKMTSKSIVSPFGFQSLATGQSVLTLSSTATNDNPNEGTTQGRTTTSNNTATVIIGSGAPHNLADGEMVTCLAAVTGNRTDTGGEACGFGIVGTFRRAGSTITQVGTTSALWTHEDDSNTAVDFNILTTVIRVRVTGVTAKTYTWHCTMHYFGPMTS